MGFFSKVGLFIINFAIFAAGVTVVALASFIINKNNQYGQMLLEGFFSLPIIVLLAGLFIVIIGFLGCCGALKENSCMLRTYAFIVIVMLIAEITLGILMLVYPKKAEESIKTAMSKPFENYGKGDDANDRTVDLLQRDFKCCGVDSYKDWEEWGNTGNNVTIGCCKHQEDATCFVGQANLDEDVAAKKIHTQGCYDAIKEELKSVVIGVGVVLFLMAIVQVLAVTCACGLAKKSRHYA